MRVLIACEFSRTVSTAFASRGHDVLSVDLLPVEGAPVANHRHEIGDARDYLYLGWDLMVAHPPCTRLANSGVRWLEERNLWSELDDAASLFSDFLSAPIARICIENPVMHGHAKRRIANYTPPSQTVQPWQFGHGETKRTCFWLRGLSTLTPTNIVDGRDARVHRMSPGPNRWRERSRFYTGIADAMANQWG